MSERGGRGTGRGARPERGSGLAGVAPQEPSFRISEVADMVGLSAHTIRAWERRYRVPTPSRTRTNQRLYALDDVEALIRMKRAAGVHGLSLRLAATELRQGH